MTTERTNRVFTEYGLGEILSIAGILYKVKLDIKPRCLKSDINTFRINEIFPVNEYEKTLSNKPVTEIQLTLFSE